MNRHGRRTDRGFTLTELLLVTAVIGVLGSSAMSAFAESPDHRLDMIERELSDAVDYARALARSDREAHGVVFDVATERVAVVDEAGAVVEDPLARRDYLLDFSGPQYPQGLDLTSADFGDTGAAIVVEPDGTAFSSGSVVLTFRGATRTLRVDLATATLRSS